MDTSIYSVDRSGFEDRQKNILYLRRFYTFLNVELLLTFVWASCAHYWYGDFGKHLYDLWYIALATGIVAGLLILVSFFTPNMKGAAGPGFIYVLFTLCFMYTFGYLSLSDRSYLVFYTITCLWFTTWALAIYSTCNSSYMSAVSGIFYIVGANAFAFQLFLIFTDLDILWLVVVMLAIIAFGFYINSNVVGMVRRHVFDVNTENAMLGAVRVWVETVMVVCRMVELIASIFVRKQN